MFSSIFRTVLTDLDRLTGTPEARSSSPYLIQFVNTGADCSELAVWDTTNCKHPIEDAPIVDLGDNEKVTYDELKQMLQVSFSPL